MTDSEIALHFKYLYDKIPHIFAAPGRINVIGEHTDYNKGWVLPASVNKYIYVAIAKNNSNLVNIKSAAFEETVSFSIQEDTIPKQRWARYFFGVIQELRKLKKYISGIDLFIFSTLPSGSGISSSAAITSAFGLALNEEFDFNLSRLKLAQIGQRCEHNFLCIKCGLMDQFASLFGEKNSLILLDCNSMDYKLIPFSFPSLKIILFDSQVKHQLADTEYNMRRNDCENGLQKIQTVHPEISILRNFDIQILSDKSIPLTDIEKKRIKFVLQENERVQNVCKSLKNNDIDNFGKQIWASHQGLKDLYEVSCSELDFLVDTAKKCEGVVGARMMGGGFGGCTINFVMENYYADFIQKMSEAFSKQYQKPARFIEFQIGDGAHKIINS